MLLKPTLALLSTTTSTSLIAKLVVDATAIPGAYTFSKLLHHPAVQSLSQDPQYSGILKHLSIFAFGTYADYYQIPQSQDCAVSSTTPATSNESLPALNPQQVDKLRQLTLMTLTSGGQKNLRYSHVRQVLNLATNREVEDVFVRAVYAGLLKGTLDPAREQINVSSVAPLRDVDPMSMSQLKASLVELVSRCDATLEKMAAEMAALRSRAEKRTVESQELKRELNVLLEKELDDWTRRPGVDLYGSGAGLGSGSLLSRSGGSAKDPRRGRILNARGLSRALGKGPSQVSSQTSPKQKATFARDDIVMDVDDEEEGTDKKRDRDAFMNE